MMTNLWRVKARYRRLAAWITGQVRIRCQAIARWIVIFSTVVILYNFFHEQTILKWEFWTQQDNPDVKAISAIADIFRNFGLGIGAIVAATIGVWFTAREKRVSEEKLRSERFTSFVQQIRDSEPLTRTDA